MVEQLNKEQALYSHIVGNFEYVLLGIHDVFEGAYFVEEYIKQKFKEELDDFEKVATDRLNSYLKCYKDEPENFIELTSSIHIVWSYTLQRYASEFLLPEEDYDDLVDGYEGLYESVAEVVKEIIIYMNMVDQTVEYNKLKRDIKAAVSGRWNIGGVGVKGAIAGMVTGSILNAGTDLVKSGINSSKYKKEKKAGEKLKEELISEIEKTLRQFISRTKRDSLRIFIGYIERCYPNALWKVNSSTVNKQIEEYNNVGDEDKPRKLLELLKADPRRKETYSSILNYILCNIKDVEREKEIYRLLNVAQQFNVSLQRETLAEVRRYLNSYDRNDIARCKEALWCVTKFSFKEVEEKKLLEDEFINFLANVGEKLSLTELETLCTEIVNMVEQLVGMGKYVYLKTIIFDIYLAECKKRELIKFVPEEIDKVLSMYKEFQSKWSYSVHSAIKDLTRCVMKFYGISLRASSLEELKEEIKKLEKINATCALDLSKEIKEQRAILQRIEEEERVELQRIEEEKSILRRTVEVIYDYDIENKCYNYKKIIFPTEEFAEKANNATKNIMEICKKLNILRLESGWENIVDELGEIYLTKLQGTDTELGDVYSELISSIKKQKKNIIQKQEYEVWDKNIKKYLQARHNAQTYCDMLEAGFESLATIEGTLQIRDNVTEEFKDKSAKVHCSLSKMLRIKMFVVTFLISVVVVIAMLNSDGIVRYVMGGVAIICWIMYIKKVYNNIRARFEEEASKKRWIKQFNTLCRFEQGQLIPNDVTLYEVQKRYVVCVEDYYNSRTEGCDLFLKQELEKAIPALKEEARKHRGHSNYVLYLLYSSNEMEIKKDMEQALKWIALGKEHDILCAVVDVMLNEKDENVKKQKIGKYRASLLKMSKYGNVFATYLLGKLALENTDEPKNHKVAVHYFNLASKNKLWLAQKAIVQE